MLYNIAIHFYMLGVAVAALFNRKVRTMWQGERRAFRELKEKVDANLIGVSTIDEVINKIV